MWYAFLFWFFHLTHGHLKTSGQLPYATGAWMTHCSQSGTAPNVSRPVGTGKGKIKSLASAHRHFVSPQLGSQGQELGPTLHLFLPKHRAYAKCLDYLAVEYAGEPHCSDCVQGGDREMKSAKGLRVAGAPKCRCPETEAERSCILRAEDAVAAPQSLPCPHSAPPRQCPEGLFIFTSKWASHFPQPHHPHPPPLNN